MTARTHKLLRVYAAGSLGLGVLAGTPSASAHSVSCPTLGAYDAANDVTMAQDADSDPMLNDLSGLAASKELPGLYWSIEDRTSNDDFSGTPEHVYLWGHDQADGSLVAQYELDNADLEFEPYFTTSSNASPDFEAIAINYRNQTDHIYVADTGAPRVSGSTDHLNIYRVTEPTGLSLSTTTIGSLPNVTRYVIRLKDSAGAVIDPQPNVEAMFVDPDTDNLFLFAKTPTDVDVDDFQDDVRFWKINSPAAAPAINDIALAGYFSYPSTHGMDSTDVITDAAMLANGRYWVVRDGNEAFYWAREPDGMGGYLNVTPTMTTYHREPPCVFAVNSASSNVEESIAFRYQPDGTGWDALLWTHDASSSAALKKAFRV